jgi:hypothetical protein
MAYSDIKDPSAHFQATTYTGAGANTVVTNGGNSDLKPDLLWIKNRTAGYAHFLVDSNRNISYAQNSSNAPYLETDSSAAENNNQNWMQSVNTDGFTTGITEHTNSNSGSAFVAWQWKANGGTTASNTDGSITSTVQANQDAGFSIVTYTGTGATATVGHGLGVAPKIIIGKRSSGSSNWWVGGSILTSTQTMYLNLDNGIDTVAESIINNVTTSTTFKLGTDTNRNAASGTHVAYCFAEKQGYSKFGKYVGNGSDNGPFVYTGFKPAFLIMKRADSAGNWVMFDTKRDTYNVTKHRLFPNLVNSDNTTRNYIDLLSNGFKMRNTDVDHNSTGSTIIYMAFAENPFVAGGIPTTAR